MCIVPLYPYCHVYDVLRLLLHVCHCTYIRCICILHVDLILHVYGYLWLNDAAGYNVIHLLLLHVQLPWHAAYARNCAYCCI